MRCEPFNLKEMPLLYTGEGSHLDVCTLLVSQKPGSQWVSMNLCMLCREPRFF